MFASYFVSPNELWLRIGTAQAPVILDVRRREVYDAAPGLIPTAAWRQPETSAERVPGLSGALRHAAEERHNRPAKAVA